MINSEDTRIEIDTPSIVSKQETKKTVVKLPQYTSVITSKSPSKSFDAPSRKEHPALPLKQDKQVKKVVYNKAKKVLKRIPNKIKTPNKI